MMRGVGGEWEDKNLKLKRGCPRFKTPPAPSTRNLIPRNWLARVLS